MLSMRWQPQGSLFVKVQLIKLPWLMFSKYCSLNLSILKPPALVSGPFASEPPLYICMVAPDKILYR